MMDDDLYRQKAAAKLEEYQAVIKQYQAKVKGKLVNSRIDVEKQMDDLQKELAEAKAKILALGDDVKDKSKEVVATMGVAVENLGQSVTQLFKLEDYQAIIKDCKEKAKGKMASSRDDFEKHLDEVQKNLDDAREKIMGLGDSAREKSGEAVAHVGNAVDQLSGKMKKLFKHHDDDD